jgi:GNAT superfamily N-acetyltransferase
VAAPSEAPNRAALPIGVRRARPDDREAVVAFSSETFGGWDYVPKAWPAWVDARDGVLLVATPQRPGRGQGAFPDADGRPLDPERPVAIARVALLSAQEAWLEGLRVDPSVRGRSVATTLQVAELRWAKAHGVRVARYFTGEQNEGSHRLGARHGFRRLSDWRSYGPRHDEGEADRDDRRQTRERLVERLVSARLAVSPADTGEVERWWARVDSDRTFAAGNRLYEWRVWALQELTRERFAAHVRSGHVVTSGNADSGGEWALAIVSVADLGVDRLHLALLVGDGRAAFELAGQAQDVAGEPIRFRLPDPDAPLLRGLRDDASATRFPAHGSALHVFERPLLDADPLPEPDAPHLLVYEEQPRPIAAPQSLSVGLPPI